MASKSTRTRLSKGILEMKFMQRTKARFDKEQEDAEGQAMYSQEITEKMKNHVSNFIVEPSYIHCEGLSDGRFSYRGMNPRLERLLELEQAEKLEKTQTKQPTEVTDQEMRKFYENNLAQTMQKKFEKKRKFDGNERGGKKKAKFAKFRKPSDN